MKHIKRSLFFLLVLMLVIFQVAHGQPAAPQLSDQIARKNSERIINVDRLTVTITSETGSFFPETTASYVKINRNGVDVLVSEDTDFDVGVLSGSFDDQLPKIIREAHRISEVLLHGHAVYKVEIDDPDALNEFGRDESDIDFYDDEEDITVTGATLWIHKTELYPIKMEMEQRSPEGYSVTVTLNMEDYREYEGLAIPHRISMNIAGFQDQFTEDDIAMMREYLQDIEEQLSELPASQREVMNEQLRPQIEQFQAILNGEFEMNEMIFIVTDVKLNS